MLYYDLIKVLIHIPGLVKVIIDVTLYYHRVPKSIVIDQGFLFTSKFWYLLYYFIGIKIKLFTTFYL